MSNDGIRLPSDNTVASQKVHRGTSTPESQTPLPPLRTAAKPSPLLTVVLQTQTLIEGKKGSLYELVLQNEPKSAPTIRVQSETDIQPGTSLLLELDENQQYRPVDKPTNEQLIKLVKLELDFWRAHLLPKTDARSFPELPTKEALINLANTLPNLKPLVNWLAQSNTAINARTVSHWIQAYLPMPSLRPQVMATAPERPIQVPVNFSVQSTLAAFQNTPNPSSTLAMGTSQTVAEKVMNAVNLPIITSVTQTQNLVVTDARLRLPIGALNATPVAHALSATDTIQRLNSPLSDSITPVPVKTEVITAPKLELSGQLFKVAQSIRGQISASDLHQIRFVRVDSSEASSRPISQAQTSLANPSNTGTNTNTTMVTAQSNLNAGSQTAGTATIQSPPVTSANQTAAQRTTNAFPQHQQNKQSAQAHVAIKPSPKATTETLRVLGAPSIETRAESRIPAELTIGLWLKEVDKQIAQSPPHLQAQLKQKAEQLLQHNFAPELKVQPSQQSGSEKSSDKDELPLIAVRNWLDATQARIQNSAINNAMHQWSFPDTTVQHMQLPLIWLGLTSWADLEWWQEKPKRKNSREKSAEEKNRWRMRMFLTLDPLAPMCADIDWSTDMTQVTFWSEDTSTLAHLNQLLPTLSSWTQGLGENSLTTKHGMPKKVSKSTETATTENHLVDIRT